MRPVVLAGAFALYSCLAIGYPVGQRDIVTEWEVYGIINPYRGVSPDDHLVVVERLRKIRFPSPAEIQKLLEWHKLPPRVKLSISGLTSSGNFDHSKVSQWQWVHRLKSWEDYGLSKEESKWIARNGAEIRLVRESSELPEAMGESRALFSENSKVVEYGLQNENSRLFEEPEVLKRLQVRVKLEIWRASRSDSEFQGVIHEINRQLKKVELKAGTSFFKTHYSSVAQENELLVVTEGLALYSLYSRMKSYLSESSGYPDIYHNLSTLFGSFCDSPELDENSDFRKLYDQLMN